MTTTALPSVAVARADIERIVLDAPDPGNAVTPLVKFQNLSPGPEETGVPVGTPIQFTMHDWLQDGQGVAILVNGVVIATLTPNFVYPVTGWSFSMNGSDWIFTPTGADALALYQSEAVITVRIETDVWAPVEWQFTVADIKPISMLGAAALSLTSLVVDFDDTVALPDGAAFTVTGVDAPAAAVGVTGATADGTTVTLALDRETSFGVRYRVACTGVTDESGNGLDVASAVFTSYQPAVPANRKFRIWDDCLPMQAKLEDSTGDLWKFAACLQDVLNVLLLRIDEWPTIFDPTRAPEVWLDLILQDLGNPFRFPMTLAEKRRLASVLVELYRLRGTEPGLINAVRFLLELNVTIVEVGVDGGELGVAKLGDNFVLGTSDLWKRFAFSVVSPQVLTDEQRTRLLAIVAVMKPANMHLASIIEPFAPPVGANHWQLGDSQLATESILHGENEPHEGRVQFYGNGTAPAPTVAGGGGTKARAGGGATATAPTVAGTVYSTDPTAPFGRNWGRGWGR